MSFIKKNPVITDIDENKLISYKFDVPAQIYATSGTYATVLYANQTVVFEGIDLLKNIVDWISLDDEITGDVAFFRILKDFRYSLTGYDYSPWFPLTLANLKNIGAVEKVTIQFRYSAIASQQNYNLVLPIKPDDHAGWYAVIPKSSNSPYQFDKDYPQQGNLTWKIGYGTNGQYHLDTSTSKFYQKVNGHWGAGIFVVKAETSGYIPTQIFGHTLSDDFVATQVLSRYPVVPINDVTLTNDLKFGESFDTSQPSTTYRPQQFDKMYLNPLFQGINMVGLEEIRATYDYPVLPPLYTPKVYVKELDIVANQWTNTYSTEPLFCLNNVGDQAIFKPPFTLKLYSIDSFSVEVDGQCSTSWNPCLKIEFRYSWNSRNWDTGWMPLTLANLKCIKPNPLKFFYIEFRFTKICDNNGLPICVTDIVINGNVQNVSSDYDKLNRFGLRSDCNYGIDSSSGSYNPATGECADGQCAPNTIIPHDWVTDLQGCGTGSGTFNPYDITQVTALNEKTANDVSNLFGWEVDYYRTEANEAGIDKMLHEYGTYDTVDKKKLKVLVPDNKFPEDQIGFNMFGLSLFDSFEIHITRAEYYAKFGVGIRPAQKDFLFFCQINKWFEVEHAQSYRDFLNASIYYKVTLTKKNDDTNIDNRTYTTEFNTMVENNQLDNLFGQDVKEDIKHVVNDPLLQNLTEITAPDTKFTYEPNVEILVNAGVSKEEILDYKKPDPIQLKINVPSVEKNIENATNVIAQHYYDLSSRNADTAVVYQKLDTDICDCCNRAITVWFNIYKYEAGAVYNIIDNFNTASNQGYKIDFIDGRMEIIWFGQVFDIDVHVSPNKWYGLVVNFNQKQATLDMYIYKRKSEANCSSTDLDLVDEASFPLTAVAYKGDLTLKLKGSLMYWTNFRLFSEIIPKSAQQLVLNQLIVKNTEYLIVGDNADRRVIAPHHKF